MTKDLPVQSALSTDRLDLKIVTTEDADFIRSLLNTKEWIANIGDRHVRSKEDAIVYIDAIMATADFYYWVVRLREAKIPIGIVSYLKRSYLDHFDIGFAFLPDFTGRGFAYEAANAVLDMVTQRPEFKTVLALTKQSNKRSIRLLEKLGFTFQKTTGMEKEKMEIYTNAASWSKTT